MDGSRGQSDPVCEVEAPPAEEGQAEETVPNLIIIRPVIQRPGDEVVWTSSAGEDLARADTPRRGMGLNGQTCGCTVCDNRDSWPRYYMGHNSRRPRGHEWIGYECFLANQEPAAGENLVQARGEIAKEEAAIAAGLSIRSTISGAAYMAAGCEGCDGLRPARHRFCVSCEAQARRQLMSSRPAQILPNKWRQAVNGWLARGDWSL